ncbi:MAG: AAA family ATPase [Bacteroidales bacterium]|nr:AAA family ATPase [Bacteroidales bacterium]
MYLSQLIINNYKSFPPQDNYVNFNSRKTIIIGKNNSGKSNILSVIEFLLGNKDPRYVGINKSDYFDNTRPIRLSAFLHFQDGAEIYKLDITKKYQGILYKEFKSNSPAFIEIRYSDIVDGTQDTTADDSEEEVAEKKDSKFKILINGKYQLHQKIKEVRSGLCKIIGVDSLRNAKDDLSGSRWTVYGQLMKSVLEDSGRYNELKNALNSLNGLVEEVLASQKSEILKNAKIISFINDIKFQLTKDNEPSELLRNLELYVKDKDKFIHIDETGTGTQSALIIGILEVALKYKSSNARIFFIDEPELFLHPLGIRYLGQLFKEFIADNLSQIIISSHSSILLSSFHPREIIRLDKPSNYTEINQLPFDYKDIDNKLARQINSGLSSEMFFADKVLIVEGETEQIIFPNLSFKNPSTHFYKNNIAVVNAQGKESIIGIIRTLELLKIKWKAIVDNDFLDMKKTFSPICKHLGLNSDEDKETIRQYLFDRGFAVLKEGETENLIPDNDLTEMTGKSIEEVVKLKLVRPKLSDTFTNELFGKSKPEIAYEIVEYYAKKETSPFDFWNEWTIK